VGVPGVNVKLGHMNAPAKDRGEIEMNQLIWLLEDQEGLRPTRNSYLARPLGKKGA
jgi:hypothetical protein